MGMEPMPRPFASGKPPPRKSTAKLGSSGAPQTTGGGFMITADFLFMFSFDYNSVFERKNPLAVTEAFRRAFPPGAGASLVIKSITGHVTEDMREHYSTVGLSEKRDAVVAFGKRLGFPSETVDKTVDGGVDA